MLKLKEIIRQLTPENYESLVQELEESKAEKFQKLLIFYREKNEADENIIEDLSLNVNAFYTLKSRLYDKIQQKLTKELGKGSGNLIKQVSEIPSLLYETPKTIAIAALKKLEKDLLENDLHNELIPVYAALKKLHYNSPKYFNYSQSYNRHIAYTLALGKASDLLSDFNRTLTEYVVARTPMQLAQLGFLKKEVDNHYRINESHQLYLHKAIVDLSSAIFLADKSLTIDDDPVEDILKKAESIFEEYTQEKTYPYLRSVFDYLSFSYYHKLDNEKMAARHLEKVNNEYPSLLDFDHTVFSWDYPAQLIRWRLERDESDTLQEEIEVLPDVSDDTLSAPQKILLGKTKAAFFFHRREYDKATQELQGLVNSVSFKHYPHAEFEVKCFLALNQILTGKEDPALILIRSVTRKVREAGMENYEQVKVWSKLINLLIKKPSDHDKKVRLILEQFERENTYPERLDFVLSLDLIQNKLVRP